MKQNNYVKACIDRLIPELGGLNVKCAECPWEPTAKKESASCLKH
jgi:hypothetical protein